MDCACFQILFYIAQPGLGVHRHIKPLAVRVINIDIFDAILIPFVQFLEGFYRGLPARMIPVPLIGHCHPWLGSTKIMAA